MSGNDREGRRERRPSLGLPVAAGRITGCRYLANRARDGTNEAALTVPHPVASL
jgi:hypothetical protein